MPRGTDREGDRHQGYSRDGYSDTRLHFCHTMATVENTIFHHRPLRLCLCCALWPRRCYGPTPREEAGLLKSEKSGGQSGRERDVIILILRVLCREARVDMAVSPPPSPSAPAAHRTVRTVSPRRSHSSHPDLRPW